MVDGAVAENRSNECRDRQTKNIQGRDTWLPGGGAWRELNAYLERITLTLLIGHHAQAYYLGERRKDTLSDTVKA
jgi:hypothetical protein